MILPIVIAAFLPMALCLTSTEKAKFSSAVTITDSGSSLTLSSNGIPTHAMGNFPNRDNPNTVTAQDFSFTIPQSPVAASTEGCLPMGSIGMAINGVAIYNVYTIDKSDAVVVEVFDDCDGHPSPDGTYHYHQVPDCIYQNTNNELLGVAMDGFPIYGPKDENGKELTSADLDNCHGRTYNGQYQYHMTRDFPYTLGCFKGSVSLSDRQLRNCEYAFAGSTTVYASSVLLIAGLMLNMFALKNKII